MKRKGKHEYKHLGLRHVLPCMYTTLSSLQYMLIQGVWSMDKDADMKLQYRFSDIVFKNPWMRRYEASMDVDTYK